VTQGVFCLHDTDVAILPFAGCPVSPKALFFHDSGLLARRLLNPSRLAWNVAREGPAIEMK
jgi:hypothetical protein